MPTSANEVRFPCPNCGLRLACEDGYGGWRIQCPGCNGAVAVPLAPTASPPGGTFWGPAPLPTRTSGTTAAKTSQLGKWQERGILAGAALLFAGAFMLWMMRWLMSEWPWSPRVSAFEIQMLLGLGVVGFSLGVAYSAQHTDSLAARLVGGCIFPLLAVAFFWAAGGILDAGCSAGCAIDDERRTALHRMFAMVPKLFGIVFLCVVVQAWLFGLRRR